MNATEFVGGLANATDFVFDGAANATEFVVDGAANATEFVVDGAVDATEFVVNTVAVTDSASMISNALSSFPAFPKSRASIGNLHIPSARAFSMPLM